MAVQPEATPPRPGRVPDPTSAVPPSGETPAAQALRTAADLASRRQWNAARRVLEAADASPEVDDAMRRRLRQRRAVYTYKDGELRLVPALEAALEVLASAGEDLATTRDPETLGIAGAVHKRMWEISGRRRQIATALGYYQRGADCAGGEEKGYNAVNAAFCLDVLADLDSEIARAAGLADESQPRRERAAALRCAVVDLLGAQAEAAYRSPSVADWWLLATVAEAALGLGDRATARRLLSVSHTLVGLPDWQLESTIRQLTALEELHPDHGSGPAGTDAVQVVADVVGRPVEQVLSISGRVGLALSGGGFRASFFHLGVLARLAELDLLRRVDVLSCVSGGSIVGAFYYLELRRRLKVTPDDQMTRAEFIDIVRTVQRDFYRATLCDLRRSALTNPVAVLRTAVEPGYNRTTTVGRLLDQHFYAPLVDGERPVLSRLGIVPVDGPVPFDPRHHNWRRSAKVPLLILNATTLNTGHNWQFTTSWMGEPYGFIDERTDANYRLERIAFAGATAPPATTLSLGQAVAASASVPGFLEPMHLDGVYPGRDVRLVDGGVQDNQGVYGLLEEDCSVILVSDASGQMNTDDSPPVWPWSTMRRSSSILMATVRSTSFRLLDDLHRSGRLHGLLYLHLKRDLRAGSIGEHGESASPSERDRGRTSYGIPRRLQRHLAGLRTDLDVFSPAEAHTLMLSGYRMATTAVPLEIPGVRVSDQPPVRWEFQVIEEAVDAAEGSPQALSLARELHLDDGDRRTRRRCAGAVVPDGRSRTGPAWRTRGRH